MGPICVTGGSGFLGSWCVSQLLEKGYVVNTTVRATRRCEVWRRRSIRKAIVSCRMLRPTSANVYVADLLTTGSFDSAVAGCTAVIHVASPFFVGGNEYTMENLLKPALDRTRHLNVLRNTLAIRQRSKRSSLLPALHACMFLLL